MKRSQNVRLEAQSFHQRFGQPPGIFNAGEASILTMPRRTSSTLYLCANDQGGIRARLPSIITTRVF